MRHIAVIGSGPAGCYLVEQLLRAADDIHVSMVERLPVPFGLVRYGVAPDHQGTKAISRLLGRAIARDRVRFFGHVEVGRDVLLDELAGSHDAVVIATGAPRDRRLEVAGESLPGVIGSAEFVRWYNDHPDHGPSVLNDVRSAVVIGNGNVAIDVVRILTKTSAEFVGSDLAPTVYEQLSRQPIESIHVVGRRGPDCAKFTQAELAELGRLDNARPRIVSAEALVRARNAGASGPIMDILEGFTQDTRHTPVDINFHFDMRVASFEGSGRLESVRFACADGTDMVVPAQLAVTCIGYVPEPCCAAAPSGGVFSNDNGRISSELYVTGWAGRGPSGTIPTNRTEAKKLAKRIAAEVDGHERGGAAALSELLAQRRVRCTDYAAWQQIDAAEQGRAEKDRCRHKFDSIEAMLDILDA